MAMLGLALVIALALGFYVCNAHEHFVTLDVASVAAPKSFRRPQKPLEAANAQAGLFLDIVHESSLRTWNKDPKKLLLERLKKDELRLQSIGQRIQRAVQQKHSDRRLASAQVYSGMSLGSGEYFVRLGLGTPRRLYYLEVDTGSDITWVQCSPCTSCYSQVDPIYDPRNSSSYRQVFCGSALCFSLEDANCQGTSCDYQVVYGDNSTTTGVLGVETFSVGKMVMRNIAFGCGHINTGLFHGEAGLLGLGGGSLSFISQVEPSVGNIFSYCLVSRDSPLQTSSPLVIGPTATPFSGKLTPLVRNPMMDTFYYAVLTGISVGGNLLPIPASEFQLSTTNGTGGVILDTGTSVTRLINSAYSLLRDAYRAASRNLPGALPGILLDTCYNFQGLPTVQIPSVVMHFQNDVDLVLPGSNILIPVNRTGVFCLAFAPSHMPISVIGNIQQQGFRISFDMQRSLISIAPRQC